MPGPKAAVSSSATPTIPKLISGLEKEALEQTIQRRIAKRAYSLFEASGRLDGNDLKHWLQAESEILQRGLEVRESGSWLAISGWVPDIEAGDVEIYLEPHRVLVRVTKSTEIGTPESERQELAQREVFLVEELKTEVEPTTASASVRDQQLTLMVKKRHPVSEAARGASAGR
jgi:HSP20 family molecular chaperone IbpA